MIHFNVLTLRNFFSYGNNVTVFQLNRPGTTLIVGEDLDNTSEGQGSNGVGKTTMLQAIVYALYDRVISEDISKDGMVNNINKKEMEVTLDFVADNGSTYKIIRQRKMKAGAEGNKVHLFENGIDISVDVVGTNKKIEEVVGMPYDMFVRIIVFSASNDSFLKLPTTSTSGPNQRDFIEDLFGLSVITEKAEKLKAIIKDTKSAFDVKKTQLEARQAEHQRHLVQIEHTERRLQQWEVQRQTTIQSLEAKLAKIDGVDIDKQRAVHANVKKVDRTITELSSEKKTAMRECQQHVTSFTKIDKEIVLLRENKCPHCKQQYAGAADEIKVKEQELITLDSTIEDLTNQVKEHEQLLTDLEALYQQLQTQIVVDNIEELARIQSDADNIRTRVEELKVEVNPHADTLAELKEIIFDQIKYDEVNALQREIDHQNFLLKLLTKNDSFLRKSLVNKYVPFLNNRVQHYLTMLGLPHVVEFQEDLTAKISHMGVDMKFGNLSTGQKARVDFAFSVAFKDVRERLHGRTNICMFDEVLDFGLDAVGVIACAKVIKHIARTEGVSIYVISHRNEIDSMFDRKMTIQMIKKFSYVKDE
jgi:DNA repair exonuclease SbcCD ATPase subunit